MNRKHNRWDSTQFAYPAISPWVSQGLDGSFVENVIMARSVIEVISKKSPLGLALLALRPNMVEIRKILRNSPI